MKQNNRHSMRWKIFFYLSAFVGVVLVLLYLFQVVFLDDFYRTVKTGQIKSTANEIVSYIDGYGIDNTLNYLDEITNNSDYCIRVTDVSGRIIYGNDSNQNICGFIGNSEEEIVSQVSVLYEKAINNNGEVLFNANTADRVNISLFPQFPFQEDTKLPHYKGISAFDYLIYGKITRANMREYFVLVNSRISVLDEIAETLKKQLFLILGIILSIALVFAFYIAKRISAPIIKTNKEAKKLAEGNYEVSFDKGSYKEIDELNETLDYAGKELNKNEKLRNELIANISHDLRTPLTMISGYAEIMRDIPQENTPENVQVIIDECHRLNALVNDILDLSKLQSKTQKLTLEEFNITLLIRDIITRLSTLLKSEYYHIEFEYEEEVFVIADIVKINQVIYNLMANAINYVGEDKVVSVCQIVDGSKVKVEVSDHGEGIEEENLPFVWDRYYKLDKVHKRPQVGTGLGLSIVKNVLEMHNAEYGVTSKLKEGTTFYFVLEKTK